MIKFNSLKSGLYILMDGTNIFYHEEHKIGEGARVFDGDLYTAVLSEAHIIDLMIDVGVRKFIELEVVKRLADVCDDSVQFALEVMGDKGGDELKRYAILREKTPYN